MTASSAPTSAAAVANAFLDIQSWDPAKGSFPPIDQMKLYKLVYYAQAWWLAHTGVPLFEEDIKAWPWGPVVSDLYGHFKSAGRQPIQEQRATVLTKSSGGYTYAEPPQPDQRVMNFLRSVWETHKGFSGVALSNATHEKGEPWTIVNELHNENLSGKPLIPVELIRDVFKGKLVASAA